MGMNRRQALGRGAALLVSGYGYASLAVADASPAVAFLDKSDLIYLTPIRSDGAESTCHGEVWFIHYNQEIFVVTKSDAWRTEAIRRGLRRASIWIGEFGVWTRAKDRYRSAPFLRIEGSIEEDTAVHEELLALFGVKYASEWGSWGPRFRKGLANGSRVLLRYQVLS